MAYEMFISGLMQVLAWPAFGFMMLGVLLGLLIGAIPGLAGVTGLVLIMPFTFGMEPVAAFALMLGAFAVTATGDTLTAVLLGVPGTAASQATVMDGYPLAKQGQAGRALGAAYAASLIGGVLGGIFMGITLPIIAPVIMYFGMPEFFMLAILGLTMVASLSGRSLMKGLGAGALGLLLATVGYAPVQPVPRYAFGIEYLYAGLPLLPFLLGLFGLPELVELASKRQGISDVPRDQSVGRGIFEGIRDTLRHWWLVIRCSAVGIYVGLVPGIGGSVADWFAYSYVVQTSKDKSRFGRGDIRGVIAPEAATTALRGGELVPTVVFGIPGSAGMAVLLSALLIHGLRPGTTMLTTQLDFTFSLVWTLIISNIVAACVMIACSHHLAKFIFVPSGMIFPAIVVLLFMGAYMANFAMGDWITLIAAGVLGYWLKQAGWPRPPIVLAVVLGPIIEPALRISMRIHGLGFLARPLVLVIGLLILATLVVTFARHLHKMRDPASAASAGDGFERNPPLSLAFALLGFAAVLGAAWMAHGWPAAVQQFPFAVGVAGIVIFAGILVLDISETRSYMREHAGVPGALRASLARSEILPALPTFAWFVAIILSAFVVGQEVTLLLFVVAYLAVRCGYSWRLWVPYLVVVAAMIFGLYGSVLNVFWHRPLIPLRQMLGL